MEMRRIRHFVALAETLNFRKAAERLNMAQPPLSVSIQKLEAELGTELFSRTSQGVRLTASGQAALPQARRVLFCDAQFEEAARHAADGTGGMLRVGFVGSSTYGLLQSLVARFRAECPGVTLILREATSATIIRCIDDDEMDVGIIRTPLMQACQSSLMPLEEDRLIAALPAGHALAGAPELSLAALKPFPFVMYGPQEAPGLRGAAMLACEQCGFIPQVAQEAVQLQTVLALVESGLGVALVPSIMQRFRNCSIAYRELSNPPSCTSTGLALAYRPSLESPAGARFRSAAVEAAANRR